MNTQPFPCNRGATGQQREKPSFLAECWNLAAPSRAGQSRAAGQQVGDLLTRDPEVSQTHRGNKIAGGASETANSGELPRYPTETAHTKLAVDVTPDDLPGDWRCEFEERAAICEYDGGEPRERAEALALIEIIKRMRRAGDPFLGDYI